MPYIYSHNTLTDSSESDDAVSGGNGIPICDHIPQSTLHTSTIIMQCVIIK